MHVIASVFHVVTSLNSRDNLPKHTLVPDAQIVGNEGKMARMKSSIVSRKKKRREEKVAGALVKSFLSALPLLRCTQTVGLEFVTELLMIPQFLLPSCCDTFISHMKRF